MSAEALLQLPIQAVLPQIVAALAQHDEAILEAPPGAGKTTAVPLALIDEPWLQGQKILLLQPRRIAAKSAALRLSANLQQAVGQRVGYRMRMESKISQNTQLEVVTEGVLTRMLQQDPSLEGVGLIIFDEFHERSLNNDLNLALVLQSRELFRDTQPLKVLIMSATLDRQASLSVLPNAPIIHSLGKSYPVDIIQALPIKLGTTVRPLEQRILSIAEQAVTKHSGSVLIFLPGQAEIERCLNLMQQSLLISSQDIELHPLYANLPFSQQQQAIAPATGRKIVLATNIAETSITIDGITVVIDSGLCRKALFDLNTGTTRLSTQSISVASSVQRAGRAGRTAPGTCYRLWSVDQQQSLAPFETPEIRNADLSSLMLNLIQWGCDDASELCWIDPPSDSAQQQALDLLQNLGAVDRQHQLTKLGGRLSQLALPPRLALICILGEQWGFSKTACNLAALLNEAKLPSLRDIDVCQHLEQIKKPSNDPVLKRIQRMSLNFQNSLSPQQKIKPLSLINEQVISLLIAAAWPDRIAQKRSDGKNYKLANGRSALLPNNDALNASRYLAVAHCGGFHGQDSDKIQLACALDVDLLKHHLAHLCMTSDQLYWDELSQRFCAQRQLSCGKLVIEAAPSKVVNNEQKRKILLEQISKQGLSLLPWTSSLSQLCARVTLLHQHCEQSSGWPNFSDKWLSENLAQWLGPHLSDDFIKRTNNLSSLKKIDLKTILMTALPWPLPLQLDDEAPTKITVPSGSRISIDYTEQPPVLAVKLQEMFGCERTPMIATKSRAKHGQPKGIALQLHLLSPAGRPLQITQDLANFWHTSYFEVQREMKGRYPKHPWPDEPMLFKATAKTKARLTTKVSKAH